MAEIPRQSTTKKIRIHAHMHGSFDEIIASISQQYGGYTSDFSQGLCSVSCRTHVTIVVKPMILTTDWTVEMCSMSESWKDVKLKNDKVEVRLIGLLHIFIAKFRLLSELQDSIIYVTCIFLTLLYP